MISAYRDHLVRRGSRPRTVEGYLTCLRVFARWLDGQGLAPERVTPDHLERFRVWLVKHRRVGPGRQQYYIAVIRGLFRHRSEHSQSVVSDPAAELVYPKLPRLLPRGVLSPAQLRQLLDTPHRDLPGLRDRVALRLMSLAGLRASEATGVDLHDVDLERGELYVGDGKGGKARIVYIDATTTVAIRHYLRERGASDSAEHPALLLRHGVNDQARNDRLGRNQLNRRVKLQAERAGLADLGVTCHALRRTFCTLMLKAGMNLRAVGELAGHAKIGTTARYIKLDDAELSRVYDRCFPKDPSGRRPAPPMQQRSAA